MGTRSGTRVQECVAKSFRFGTRFFRLDTRVQDRLGWVQGYKNHLDWVHGYKIVRVVQGRLY